MRCLKLLFVFLILLLSVTSSFSQHSIPVLVKGDGNGVSVHSPDGGFQYSHFKNSSVTIRKITARWKLSTLYGQPVVDGVFSWEAGRGTPDDYLDWRDYILLECTPVKSVGYLVYIPVMPTVPKSGMGYGFNTPGSPNWIDLFKTRTGEPLKVAVPDFSVKMAKDIWKNGFYVTGIVLVRYKGIGESLPIEFERNKYSLLKRPYTLSLTNMDTVSTISQLIIKDVSATLKSARFSIICTNSVSGMSHIIFDYKEPSLFQFGWNKVKIRINTGDFMLTDSLNVFCAEGHERKLLVDNFDNGTLSDNWEISGYQSGSSSISVNDGRVLIRQGGEKTAIILSTKPLQIDRQRPVIIEFTSTVMKDNSCYKVWLYLNENSILCRKRCDVTERVKVVYDLQNATLTSYIDGEIIETIGNVPLNSADGRLSIKFFSNHFENWYIDDISVLQP